MSFHPSVEESINLLSKKWNVPPEIYDLHIGKRDDVIETTVYVDGVLFHIPILTRDNLYVIWKCLWPDCHNCCERQIRIPLIKEDIEILTKKLGYETKADFIKNETILSTFQQKPNDQILITRTMLSLKRKKDETENDDGKMVPCRFLNDEGCGIHPDKPSVCWMFPFAPWTERNSAGTLIPHARFQFTGDCPGFYLDKSIDAMMPELKEYSKKIIDYLKAFNRSEKEHYVSSSGYVMRQ